MSTCPVHSRRVVIRLVALVFTRGARCPWQEGPAESCLAREVGEVGLVGKDLEACGAHWPGRAKPFGLLELRVGARANLGEDGGWVLSVSVCGK